jgi:hypothetical protein
MTEISEHDGRAPVVAPNGQRLSDVVVEAWLAYLSATQQVGEICIDVDIAGSCVRLRFAGDSLVEPIMTALDHRRVPEAGHPDITIGLFDFRSTGQRALLVDLLEQRACPNGAIWRWSEQGSQLLYQRRPVQTVQAFDARHQRTLFWISDACELPAWDRCKPLLQALHWTLARGPWQPIHAGAVCGAQGGVLLGGKGGAGKSTTALACVRAGWRYAGDDYVLVKTSPEPRVENLFNSARLWDDMLLRFPEFQRTLTNPAASPDEKADLRLADCMPRQDFVGFPLRAILLPNVTEAPGSAIRPASPAQAMIALAPTTMLMPHVDSSKVFRRIVDLVKALPAFQLNLGTDIDRIPLAIENLLTTLPP